MGRDHNALPSGEIEIPWSTCVPAIGKMRINDAAVDVVSVPLYRKLRGKDVWLIRSNDEIERALAKARANAQRDYLAKNVALP
jgi:hypothetical protein